MSDHQHPYHPSRCPSRRHFLLTTTIAATVFGFAGHHGLAAPRLAPTRACGDDDDRHQLTRRQGPGPFYKPSSPERGDLREPGMAGIPVVFKGRVLTRDCRPIPGAIVDLWQADSHGDYDNRGFRLRGHVVTDQDGRYVFRTIRPARYTGRTPHFHVKVFAPNGPTLTTQLYFPDEPKNQRDSLFHPDLLMRLAESDGGQVAEFDFVLDRG